jgi:drug/metabolite transporter (DMT)-like permease
VSAAVAGAPTAVPAARVPWQVKFVLLSLIWGSSFLLMKVGLGSLEAVQISWYRVLTGGAVLLALLLATGRALPRSRRVWAHLSVAGFLLATLPFTLFAAAEERISSALAGIGNATTPMASVLFGLLLLPAARLPWNKVVAVALGLLGVVVVMQPWQVDGRPDLLGFAMALVAGASYGLGWTWVKRHLSDDDLGGLTMPTAMMTTAMVQMTVVALVWWAARGGEVATPFSFRADEPASGHLAALVAVLVLGLVGTGLAQNLQYDVVRAAGPTVATTVTYLIPVVAVALGVVFLHERLAWPQLVGAGVVLAAAVVIGRPSRPAAVRERPTAAQVP